MGLWDKAKMLDGLRMDTEYGEQAPFILYGMKVAGEIDLENGLAPATKTKLLTEAAVSDGKGSFSPAGTKDRELKVVGTLSGPIAQLASQASEADFPVVVSWETKPTKTREKATVLNFLAEFTGKVPAESDVPEDWHRV